LLIVDHNEGDMDHRDSMETLRLVLAIINQSEEDVRGTMEKSLKRLRESKAFILGAINTLEGLGGPRGTAMGNDTPPQSARPASSKAVQQQQAKATAPIRKGGREEKGGVGVLRATTLRFEAVAGKKGRPHGGTVQEDIDSSPDGGEKRKRVVDEEEGASDDKGGKKGQRRKGHKHRGSSEKRVL
jgi:hypothetical protein